MQEGRMAWVLKHFGLIAAVCILCLGVGLFFGRLLLRQNMGALVLQTDRTVIAESTPVPAADDLVDLNTASVNELSALPGLGDVLAHRIVDYRRENGRFRFPDEIMNIPGIDEKTYMALRDRITAG